MNKGKNTRERIMDIAEEGVLQKGFSATSIEEIIVAAEITKSGFFYHFKDKNELAIALIERYIQEDNRILGDLFSRAKELHDDPLHQFLIGLKLLAELMEDLPNGHPGCLVATFCYQERLFDNRVKDLNKKGVLEWRYMFIKELEAIAEKYPPKDDVNLDDVADMVTNTVEGGIIMSKALNNPQILPNQIMLLRSYIKLLFVP
ncbi:MAG: TetR/AcrR family transcriptional regulator [Methyloligellaceae bacterium]